MNTQILQLHYKQFKNRLKNEELKIEQGFYKEFAREQSENEAGEDKRDVAQQIGFTCDEKNNQR